MTEAPPAGPFIEPHRTSLLEVFSTGGGKFVAVITGRRRVWLLGDVTPSWAYPRLAIGSRLIELALLAWLAWNVWACVGLLRAMLALEQLK